MPQTRTRTTALLLVASALWLAGCSGGPTVYNAQIYHDRWPDFFYGGGTPEYLAVVWGNSFHTDKTATEAVVIESIERMVFNADHARSGLPCGDLSKLRPGPAPSGNVRIQAALCRSGAMLTGVEGVVENVSGPDDPKFRQLVYQVAVKLFRYQPGSGGHRRAEAT
jgi:hypothetical protein